MHQSVRGYRIGTLLGRQDASVVFAVTNPFVPEPLAMKVVTDRRFRTEETAERISTHAKAVAALTSPHIARPIDAGRLPTGEPFVVTMQTPGQDLAASLVTHGPRPEAEARRILAEACDGLAEAHAIGLVHGQLRPERLVLGDVVVVTGFDAPLPADPNARQAISVEKLAYAAPEQIGPVTELDARTDVWALGVILYEVMTGQRPYQVANVPDLVEAVKSPPALLLETLSPLGEIAKRCLSYDRDARYANASALAAALRAEVEAPAPVSTVDPKDAVTRAEPMPAIDVAIEVELPPPPPSAPPSSRPSAKPSQPSVPPGPQSVTQPSQLRLAARRTDPPNFRPHRADFRRFLYLISIAGAWGFLALSIVRLVVG